MKVKFSFYYRNKSCKCLHLSVVVYYITVLYVLLLAANTLHTTVNSRVQWPPLYSRLHTPVKSFVMTDLYSTKTCNFSRTVQTFYIHCMCVDTLTGFFLFTNRLVSSYLYLHLSNTQSICGTLSKQVSIRCSHWQDRTGGWMLPLQHGKLYKITYI